MSSYRDIIPKLHAIGLRPNVLIDVKQDGEVVKGLTLFETPMLMDKRIKEMKKVLGDAYEYIKMTTIQEIIITKKENK
jgi:hypothetical protein